VIALEKVDSTFALLILLIVLVFAMMFFGWFMMKNTNHIVEYQRDANGYIIGIVEKWA